MADADCVSKYKVEARVSTVDGKHASIWERQARQNPFVAVNFGGGFKKRELGLCQYQAKAMSAAFKAIGN